MKVQNNHPVKKYPIIGACGLDCGLCPSYNRETKSRCGGCGSWGSGEGARSCSLLTCCAKKHNLSTCGECIEIEFCPRVMKLMEQASRRDSIISYLPIKGNFEFIQKNGIEKWAARQQEKMAFLKTLLDEYNDGRSKTFYCMSIQLLPLDEAKKALVQAKKSISPQMTAKEKAAAVREALEGAAGRLGVELRLRGGK